MGGHVGDCKGGLWGQGGGTPQGVQLARPQYIARKPHYTGIELYVLCDNTHGYVVDVYLYTGRHGRIHRTGTCAGNPRVKGIGGRG